MTQAGVKSLTWGGEILDSAIRKNRPYNRHILTVKHRCKQNTLATEVRL